MAQVSIAGNIAAQFTSNNIRKVSDDLETSSKRLSSGMQITRARDDAAGLSIGASLEVDKNTSEAAFTTAQQALAILSIADAGMSNIASIASRLKALAAKANNGALGTNELSYIKNEMDALISQIGTVVTTTKFNGTVLLDGTYTSKNFQVGLLAADTIAVTLPALDPTTLGISTVDVTTNVATANNSIDAAVNTIKTARAQLGATQARFDYAASNLQSAISNIASAAAVYLEADFAKVSTDFATQQTKLQAGIATLAQVNNLTSNLLKLLS